jgi:hypothetical protein
MALKFDDDDKKVIAEVAGEAITTALTAALEDKIGDKALGQRLNKVVGDHLKRELPKFGETLGQTLLEKLKPADSTDDDAVDDDKGKGAKGKPDPAVTKQLADMQKKIDAADAKAKAAEEKTAAAETKRLRGEQRDAAAKLLRAAGLDDARTSGALALLHTERGLIAHAEDGKVIWKSGDDEQPLDKGIDAWLKTDEGKAYIPAKVTGGGGSSGARGAAGGGKQTNGKVSDDDANAAFEAWRTGGLGR